MKTYRLARGWRIVTYILCVGFTALAIFFFYKAAASLDDIPAPYLYTLGALFLLFLVYYMYMDARYGKLIIADDHVAIVSPFGKDTLSFDAIGGYRRTENYLQIVPKDRKKNKTIKASIYLGESTEIEQWLLNQFGDLDETAIEEEEKEILKNPELGLTEEARRMRLQEARKAAKYINGLSWGIAIWVMFFPRPYLLAITAGMVWPLIAILACYHYRGLMQGGDSKQTAYPSVAFAFFIPGMILSSRALLDFTVLEYDRIWIPMTILIAGITIFYGIPTNLFRPKKWENIVLMFLTPLLMAAYSFGTLLLINCAFDRSTPTTYPTVIIDKHFSSGKTTTYYLDLAPWGERTGDEEVKVTRNQYEKANVSDSVIVYQYPGKLLIPWIDVEL